MIDFYNERQRIARKEHECLLCGGIIGVGEKHFDIACSVDGEFESFRLHTRCYNFVEAYCSETGEREWADDEVRDYIESTYCLAPERICPESYEDIDDLECGRDIFACPHLTEKFGDVIK